MARRGPRPQPSALNRLRGHPGKRKTRRALEPPAPTAALLRPPRWLDAAAKAEWRRLAPELVRLGVLTLLDVGMFAGYCAWFARWRACETELVALKRIITKTPSGYVRAHPLVTMTRDAAKMMDLFASHFGLSAADRASMSLPLDPTAPAHDTPTRPAPAAPRDEFDVFLQKTRRTPDGVS